MSGVAVVLTTVGSELEAARVSRALVERKLAACVSVLPGVSSTYRWKESIETSSEWLLLIKTRADRYEEVRAALAELHTYELPEIVMIDAARVDPRYAAWIDDSVT